MVRAYVDQLWTNHWPPAICMNVWLLPNVKFCLTHCVWMFHNLHGYKCLPRWPTGTQHGYHGYWSSGTKLLHWCPWSKKTYGLGHPPYAWTSDCYLMSGFCLTLCIWMFHKLHGYKCLPRWPTGTQHGDHGYWLSGTKLLHWYHWSIKNIQWLL